MPRDEGLPSGENWLPEGISRYLDSHPGFPESQPRIYVKFRPAGVNVLFWALLDTGAHFCLLNEGTAGLVRDGLAEDVGTFSVLTAFGPVQGPLYRHQITVIAEAGKSLDVDATVFAPTGWQGPCVLGYAGLLERMRFAIDPRGSQFGFGAV